MSIDFREEATLGRVKTNMYSRMKSDMKALVEYETRSLASNARFHWDGDRKVWTKKLRECRFNEFVKTLAFGVEII